MPSWDPTQYDRFADERARPFRDLLHRVDAQQPRLVLDLGCGNGRLTLELAARWPDARVVGVDSSPEMLAAARERQGSDAVEWVEADLTDWQIADLDAAPDVIVSNATLQWIPMHLPLVQRWLDALAPGGWFAMQVPGNFESPTHALMRQVAAEHPRRAELEAATKRFGAGEPSTYLQILSAAGLAVDVWETTYLHVLDPDAEQENPVLEWVSGTGLRSVLDLLTDDQERAVFLADYGDRVAQAYPRTAAGVILPFRRVFAVGHKPS
ncbi:methyltransferase domain-containing protein [Marihabitans asiaticum]|uniref:Trans-aconitate 2-methyltransferase n=1 Tax=Marihabitans asiaticum TaxID=415218 RepID=A0A560WDT0_9MICO|nr:methyltransferase domain-containing protein [Marihabitans asiaticum]TWD15615.1 trans-aconitate 2-methyltransferase [Marihabitans asiaticum]